MHYYSQVHLGFGMLNLKTSDFIIHNSLILKYIILNIEYDIEYE